MTNICKQFVPRSDPDQARQNFRPDLHPLTVSLKGDENYPVGKEIKKNIFRIVTVLLITWFVNSKQDYVSGSI